MSDTEHCAVQPVDSSERFEAVHLEDASGSRPGWRTACHCMLWAATEALALDQVPTRAYVMMQLRDDGYWGFPGGLVDEGEQLVQCVNRELVEELGPAASSVNVQLADHVSAHKVDKHKLLLHFFVKTITEPLYLQIEKGIFSAPHFGIETFGVTRVPVFITRRGGGLPIFLTHNFIGNAFDQLLIGLKHAKILDTEEIEKSLSLRQEKLNKS